MASVPLTERSEGRARTGPPSPVCARAALGWAGRSVGLAPESPGVPPRDSLPVTCRSPHPQTLRRERTDPGQLSGHRCPEPLGWRGWSSGPTVGRTPRAGPESRPERGTGIRSQGFLVLRAPRLPGGEAGGCFALHPKARGWGRGRSPHSLGRAQTCGGQERGHFSGLQMFSRTRCEHGDRLEQGRRVCLCPPKGLRGPDRTRGVRGA